MGHIANTLKVILMFFVIFLLLILMYLYTQPPNVSIYLYNNICILLS